MLTKIKFAVAAALVVGAVSAASAANDNQSQNRGGADFGPLGQCFAPPDCDWRGDQQGYRSRKGLHGFAYAPDSRYRHHRDSRRERISQ
jgi:hypothetical protein